MRFTKKHLGGGLIEAVTEGLYDGTLNCLREYVQNAIDAKAKTVDISFEGPDVLVIKDDGTGMDETSLENALSMGISDKGEKDVGWRGIGIWSGTSACHRLVIITRKTGGKKLRISIDNDYLRSQIRPRAGIRKPAEEILTSATSEIESLPFGKDEQREDEHYTIVRLESILIQQRAVFNKKDIAEYLSTHVPAPFNTGAFGQASHIERELEAKRVEVSRIEVKFEKESITRPPTNGDIFYKKVIWKEFVVSNELVAIGWVLLSNRNISPEPPNRGITFRIKGFAIGEANLVRKQYEGTYSPWHFGEIHIISKTIRENSARNNFEYNSVTLQPFLEQVRAFVSELQKLNQYASSTTDPRHLEKASQDVKKGDYASAHKSIEKVRKRLSQDRSFPPELAFKPMKAAIEAEGKRERSRMTKLDSMIKAGLIATPPYARYNLNSILECLHPEVRKVVRKCIRGGQSQLSLAITDPLVDLLKKRTGSGSNEMHDLTQVAFDWESVNGHKTGKGPLLTIAGQFDVQGSKDGRNRRLASTNRRFGVMVYTIHDLLVNLCKHEKGKKPFSWYEKAPDLRRQQLDAEIAMMINFVYYLTERAEQCQKG